MRVDVTKITQSFQQIVSLANIGAAVVQSGADVVAKVLEIVRARGYEVDTQALDEMIIDAEARRQVAAREKDAQE